MDKLRLMCSNGGHIVPRPHDKTLCYVGGETRMIAVDRHTTLLDLSHRLSKTLIESSSSKTTSFTIKYQLPSEDLDSLISVTTDEDLENMIEEYERLTSSSSTTVSKPSRLRLFIFPNNPESFNSIGSVLESSAKSDDWFVNALNGTNSGFSDTSSGNNCLLNLDDDDDGDEISPPEKTINFKNATGENMNTSGQDVHSVPNSPMMDTTSSFGSASSTPSLSNLLPTSSAPVIDSVLSDSTVTDQLSPLVQVQSSSTNNQPADQSSPRIQMQQQQLQNPTYLMSTQMDTQHPHLHNQQMQYLPQLQYIHHPAHQQPGVGPVSSYYHPQQRPIDQQSFVYYIPARQQQQGYNFPLQQPQPSHVDVLNSQGAVKTEFMPGGYGTTNSVGPQLVRVLSSRRNPPQYVGYSEIHQPSQPQYSNDR